MGRKSRFTTLHVIVLAALALVAIVSVVTYMDLSRGSLRLRGSANPAQPAHRPLVELALAAPEIQDALGLSDSLVIASSTRLCEVPQSIECFQANYVSAAGDQVTLLLARLTSLDDAVDFGLRMKYQLDQEETATEILVRATPENFRWLDKIDVAGNPSYGGGANQGSIAIYVKWQPASAVSDDDAALMFSSLLDVQLKKIESGP
jgi:hypothetical protein